MRLQQENKMRFHSHRKVDLRSAFKPKDNL